MNLDSTAWHEASLTDVTSPDAPIGYGIVQVGPYVRDGVPVLAIRDLLNPSQQSAHRTSPKIEAQYRRSRVRPGDILISVKGTTGRIGIVPEGFTGNISRDVARLRLRDEHDPRYWLHLLRSERAQQTLQLAAVGTTRQELSIGTLKTLRFPFPCKAEQSRIANVLTDVDDLIHSLERVILKRCDLKLAAARQLLAKDSHGNGWTRVPLGDLASVEKGRQLSRVNMDPMGTVPVWNGGVEPSGFTTAANVFDPVVTVSEGGNSCGWVGRPGGPFWLGGHCYALRSRTPDIPLAFLYHALKFREEDIMALRVGSGLPNIQKGRLRTFPLDIPVDRAEAVSISQTLDDFDRQIRSLQAKLYKALAVKQGMLQQLVHGGSV
jgi:type I restriction enzyme S subunit